MILSVAAFAASEETNEAETSVAVIGIALDKDYIAVETGSNASLVAAVTPADADDKTVTWTSSDEDVATVENGTVTGVAAGTAVVTAKAGSFSATCEVAVAAEITAVSDVAELEEALASVADGAYIQLNEGTYTLNQQIRLTGVNNVTLAAAGEVTVTAEAAFTNGDGSRGFAPLLTMVSCENVTVRGIAFKDAKDISLSELDPSWSGTDYGHGVNVVDSKNIIFINVRAEDNICGFVINHSSVTMKAVTTSGNVWGGVNIDAKSYTDEQTSLTADEACSFGENAAIYADSSAEYITVEAAGYTATVVEGVTVWTKAEA